MRARALALWLAGCAGATSDSGDRSADGAEGTDGADGTGGADGADGSDGEDGSDGTDALEELLQGVLAGLDAPPEALDPPTDLDPAAVALGRALFYDPVLSGNKDVSCASCHHPAWGTGDGLSLSVGTGGAGVGPARAEGAYPGFVPRHALDLFNRGDARWHTLFWDGRVADRDGRLDTPLGGALPDGLDGPLAAQALFPLLDRQEMRGQPGDVAVDGADNELAVAPDEAAALAGVVDRLVALEGYPPLFEAAWPGEAPTIAHVANALAAYQASAFAFTDTPWDRYLRGDTAALSDSQKLGAVVFFGDGGCANCHGGALLTDQRLHVTGVPQLGPGLGDAAPFDPGGQSASGDADERFAFRTPPLRNVALTAPYMHDGAYLTLEEAVLHYGSPEDAARTFDAAGLHPDLQGTVQQGAEHLADLEGRLSPDLPTGDATTVGLSNLREFLDALTDPAAADLSGLVPETVPSGLPVGGAR